MFVDPILNEQNVLAGNACVNTLFLGNLFHRFPGFQKFDVNALTPYQLSALAEVKKQVLFFFLAGKINIYRAVFFFLTLLDQTRV